MIRVPLKFTEPGMKLALPVYHPERQGCVLLKNAYKLDNSMINRLMKMHITDVWIEFPHLENIAQYINTKLSGIRAEMLSIIDDITQKFISGNSARVKWSTFNDLMEVFMAEVVHNFTAAIYIDDSVISCNPLLRHAGNTCMLASLLGFKLHGYLVRQRRRMNPSGASEIYSLAKGAFLHDIGLYKVTDEARAHWSENRDEKHKPWQVHVEKGYQMVTGQVDPATAATVLQHHQYFDGSGFPIKQNWEGKEFGLIGENIHIFARIVAAADQFDEIKNQPNGTTWPTVRVLRTLTSGATCRRLDPIILKTLLQVVPAYAPGSLVKLSDGRSGFILDWNQAAPCRPSVAIVDDIMAYINGKTGTPEVVNLYHCPDTKIIESEGTDVSKYNFDIPKHLQAAMGKEQNYGSKHKDNDKTAA